jgi:hypothetical protein
VVGNEIEWLDDDPTSSGPADVVHVGSRGPHWGGGGNRRWLYAVAALAIVIGLLIAFRPHDAKRGAGASPTASPSRSTAASPPSPSSPSPSSPGSSPATTDPSAVTTVPGGTPLLNVAPNWVLFGHGSSSVFRIQLATGQVVSSPIPLLSSDGQSGFIAGPNEVIVQPVDSVPGFAVPDGRPATALPSGFPLGGTALPGPDANHVWTSDPEDNTMTLIGIDGTATGTRLTVPSQYSTPVADGAGYLLFYGTGGIYDLRPSGITRVTTGDLIATGPSAFLTNECDVQFRCFVTAINRSTGAHHTLRATTDQYSSNGIISPDGRTAAVLSGGSNTATGQVQLINMATGANSATPVSLDPNFNYQDGLFVWSPDSKWLFVTNGVGRIYAIDAAANKVTELGVNLGPVSQLALRAS